MKNLMKKPYMAYVMPALTVALLLWGAWIFSSAPKDELGPMLLGGGVFVIGLGISGVDHYVSKSYWGNFWKAETEFGPKVQFFSWLTMSVLAWMMWHSTSLSWLAWGFVGLGLLLLFYWFTGLFNKTKPRG